MTDARTLMAAVAIGALGGGGAVAVATGGETLTPAAPKLTIPPSPIGRGFDAVWYEQALAAARQEYPDLVDLMGDAAPGATITLGAVFPHGARLIDWSVDCVKLGSYAASACVVGPAATLWAVIGSTCEDRGERTWCEVKLRNEAADAQRALVWVRWERP